MTHTVLQKLSAPLVHREMRVASRRAATYWGRVVLLLLTMMPIVPVVFAYYFTRGAAGSLGIIGPQLLLAQAYILFFWLVAGAVQSASDAISFEKREGTLGLMFLTDLKPFDIVSGKLAAVSMRMLHGLLAAIPALGVPLLAGGVTFGDCLRLALLLIQALFVALASTLFVSTLSHREYRAAGWAVVPIAILLGGVPLAKSLGADWPALDWLNLANPIMALQTFMDADYQRDRTLFWVRMGAVHLLGWIYVALTCLALPRVWQDRAGDVSRLGLRRRYQQWLMGKPAVRNSYRRGTLPVNPLLWYLAREQRAQWFPWLLLLVVVGGLLGFYLRRPSDFQLGIAEFLLISWLTHLAFKHWIATVAGRAFALDRNPGALELILSTPLTNAELMRGPLLAIRQRFLGPVMALVILEIVVAIPVLNYSHSHASNDIATWEAVFWANLVLFPFDLIALTVTGLWKGVVSKNASQAVSGTHWWVLLMPWICSMAMAVSIVVGASRFTAADFFVLLFFTSVLIAIGMTAYSWQKLKEKLRQSILERFAGAEPWLNSWRWLGRVIAETFTPGTRRIP